MKLLLAALIATLAFSAGRQDGINHAIEDSMIFAVDCYNPDDPESSAWNGYDLEIYIELDGEIYVHGLYQG